MAYQADLSIIATTAAMNFNTMWSKKSLHPLRKQAGLLYALCGPMIKGPTAEGAAEFENVSDFTGDKIEHRMLMKFDAPAEVAPGADEVARVTLSYDANRWGNFEWEAANIPHHVPVPHSELRKVANSGGIKSAKFESFQEEYFDMIMLSYENLIATRLWEANAPTNAKVGGLPYAFTDAQSDESAYSVYGKFARADSAHADFRSKVYRNVGAITYKKIKNGIYWAGTKHCNLKNAFCGAGVYAAVDAATTTYTRITHDENWTKFGGNWIQIASLKFILDGYAPSGTMIAVDPKHSRIYKSKGDLVTYFGNDPTLKNSYVIQTSLDFQYLTRQFSSGVKWKGIDEDLAA